MQEITFILDGKGIEPRLGSPKWFHRPSEASCVFNEKRLFHGSMDSTRCCKHSSGRSGPCWLHSDAFILLSTYSTSSQRCSVWFRYEECLSWAEGNGGRRHVWKNPAATCACNMTFYLPKCTVTTKTTSFHWYMSIHRGSWDHAWFHTKPHFLVLCWLEWEVAAMCCFSPSNSRLNDVCFLKRPSAHCCCTELSFICSLLNKFCYSLLWVLSQATTVVSPAQHAYISIFFSFTGYCTRSSKTET